MKIAIIAHGYSGATLPLAKHLSDQGHQVDCYYFCWHGASQMESLEYGKKQSALSLIYKIAPSSTLYRYLNHDINVGIVPVFNPNGRFGKIRMLVQSVCNRIHIKSLACMLECRHYDFVNVILYTKFDYEILKHLRTHGVNCCVSYHEVMADLTKDSGLLNIVEKANALNTPIVVHSEKTRNDLLRLSQVDEKRIRLIHFGLFESFLQYGEGKEVSGVGNDFLLYLGFIKPYKGLRYLYEAVQKISNIKDLRIVVAGGGYDSVLDLMKQDNRFTVINRFIDNAELVSLMRSCKGVVCPYIGASQSGLVQTAMVFEKPVVATKVGAFAELIKDGTNGFLANPADADDLARCIERLYLHRESYDYSLPESLDWHHIASQYIDLFLSR